MHLIRKMGREYLNGRVEMYIKVPILMMRGMGMVK
jgi:hypothetical protein